MEQNLEQSVSLSSGSKRKLTAFVAFMVLLIAALSAGWYWAAGKLDETLTGFAGQLEKSGKTFKCDNQQVNGYPFRIGVFCDKVDFADPSAGVSVSGPAFRSAAQLYRPGHVVAELDGPYNVSVPGFAPLSLDWSNLKSSSKLDTGGFQRLSLVADELTIAANDFGQLDLLGSLSQLQFHARPDPKAEETDLDVAFSGDQWKINDGGAGLIEPVSFNFQAQIANGLKMIREGQDLIWALQHNGGKAMLSDFTFSTQGGGSLKVSGPLEVNDSGIVSGELVFNIDDPKNLMNYAGSVFPPAATALSDIVHYLDAVAEKTDGKARIKDLKVVIKDGKVILGFFEIADIPRLF